MKPFFGFIIIIILSVFFFSSCGKKGDPTLKPIEEPLPKRVESRLNHAK